jgi:hypothetical protein
MAARLNKKYFGNRNIGSTSTTSDDGIGGQGVASITLGGINNSNGYALYDPIEISAPNIPGGVQATARVSALGASNSITAIEVTEKGSGYTSVPTVTEGVGGVQGTLTFTAVLTTDSGAPSSSTNQENAILAFAYIGGSRKLVDIIGQKGARRYKVTDGTDTEVCSLVTDGAANAAGEMDITVLDSDGGAYWVKKLNNRRCTVVSKASGGGTQFATDSSVPWTFGSATEDVSVSISNA